MKKKLEFLCEIIYADHRSGHITSRIGKINKYQLRTYSKNSNDFIVFKEKYNFPILKTDIKEIIVLRDDSYIPVNKTSSRTIKYMKIKESGKIS